MNAKTQTTSVLIVEDDEGDYTLTHGLLRRTAGEFVVTWADRLEATLAALREKPFDVILLDLNLPDSTGWDTLDTVLRQAPVTALIVLTGRDDEQTGEQAVHRGAQDYLVKSHLTESPHLLVRSIRYAIQRCRLQGELIESRVRQERFKFEKLESLGVLAGGIAHDFNNLLMGIMGNIALARESVPVGHEARQLLDEAEQASIRATSLTRQLLTFARGGNPVKVRVAIGDVVSECVTFALRGSSVKSDLQIPKDLWSCEMDRGHVAQAIHNIVINAIQAMPQGGTLHTACENLTASGGNPGGLKDGRYVRISIRDEGTGIPPEYLTRIFDPYFTTKQSGSGLGLAMVYAVINKHGGSIEVESELGKGSTFHVLLPAVDAPPAVAPPTTGPVSVAGARVLVLDDDPAVRTLLADYLKRLECVPTITHSGGDTVAAYKDAAEKGSPYDAVILDLTVPGGYGGKRVIGELLAFDPRVKAIVSSGYSTDPILANFREYGFKAILAKPYRLVDLSFILSAVLGPRAKEGG
jgi:signal transduction histidine kinase